MDRGDTSIEALAAQRGVLRGLGPERRVELAVEMSEESREISRAGIRARHPDYDEEDVESALLRMLYGDALFREAWPARLVRDP